MAFQSLYRKYRPQRFGELVGQDHVTTALRNAVREDRVGHAYLFSGPRGTGKTTTARILAKALNCLELGADGEPCGQCASCDAIAHGTFNDLIELDAASNRGVDDARDLVARINLGLGATSKRKVYLLDEVHMLTKEASNTLLKTLEEPPAHVVFVLATTEADRVLPTIRSRTQHFAFTLHSIDELVTILSSVLDDEGVASEPDALAVVARLAKGSARDALSILDQVLAQADGAITLDLVDRALGGSPFDARLAVLDAIAAEDPAGALVGVAGLLDTGHEPRRVAEDLLRSLRDAFVLTSGGGRVPVEATVDEQERLRAVGDALGTAAVVRALETLGQAVNDMRARESTDPRLTLEIALVRLARRDTGGPLQVLADRVDRLEARLAGGELVAPAPGPEPSAPASRPEAPVPAAGRKAALGAFRTPERPTAPAPVEPVTPEPAPAVAEPPEAPATPPPAPPASDTSSVPDLVLDDVIVAWERVLEAVPRAVRSAVQDAQPLRVDGNVVTFGVSRAQMEIVKPRFQKEADTIRNAFIAELGAPPRFKFAVHEWTDGDGPRARRASRSTPPEAEATPEPEEPHVDLVDEAVDQAVDPDELVDAPPAAGATVDSVTRLATTFGATVVEEHPR
ncbi:MAG: DNA polymerase III subunit gamma/tau [Actinobacteria bacterium]|nr:DNA polymerase III subunit gamma/tau [Actinomycetota bacterium]